jgi:hypothetical protein
LVNNYAEKDMPKKYRLNNDMLNETLQMIIRVNKQQLYLSASIIQA